MRRLLLLLSYGGRTFALVAVFGLATVEGTTPHTHLPAARRIAVDLTHRCLTALLEGRLHWKDLRRFQRMRLTSALRAKWGLRG